MFKAGTEIGELQKLLSIDVAPTALAWHMTGEGSIWGGTK